MRKTYYLLVAALVFMAAACNKSESINVNESPTSPDPEEELPVKVTYIKAEGGESTKASINDSDATFTWNTGDQIAVYAGGYKISDVLSSSYNGTNAATFSFSGVNAVEENDRANFAVFPASLVYDSSSNLYDTDVTASSLKINLPASYTLAQVQDEVSPVPMIATNAKDGDLAFKSICALVRVTAVNISKDADHIAVTFPGKKVQGEFTLTSVAPGTTGVVTSDTDGTDDTITITDLGISSFTASLVLNVPVPTGVADSQDYGDIKVTVYDSGNHKINAITTPLKLSAGVPAAWAPGRKASRKVTATLPVFSVSKSGKKAVFAPGNLQAVIGTAPDENGVALASSWSFASSQDSFIGNTTGNKTLTAGATVDLFCWVGASATYDSYGLVLKKGNDTDAHGNTSSESLKTDWGTLTIGTYTSGYWRTPASTDWRWVLGDQIDYTPGTTDFDNAVKVGTNCRYSSTLNSVENARFVKAKVNSCWGLIVFPDNYSHPYGVTLPSNINVSSTLAFNDSSGISAYTLEDWEKMEACGCVFLPAAGRRSTWNENYTVSSSSPSDGCMALYWSSNTGNAAKGNMMQAANKVGSTFNADRWYGQSVRLIHDVN